MTDRLADTALRLLAPRASVLGFNDSDSLQNIIVNELPNGSLCFVIENRSFYVLDKLSTAAPLGTLVVQPLGGPGRWILMSSAGALSGFWQGTNVLTSPKFDILSANRWERLTSASPGQWSVFNLSPASGFIVDVNTGRMTYKGPPAPFEVTAALSLLISSGQEPAPVVPTDVEMTVDLNGALAGNTTDVNTSQIETFDTVDAFHALTVVQKFDLVFNDFIDIVARNILDTADIETPEVNIIIRKL
jgi:hypothetical protein